MEFIAEIGGNHKGDFGLAKKLVEDACMSKSTAIKLQLYSANGLVSRKADPTRFDHFTTFELSKDEYIELIQMIKSSGKKFCASVWDESMFDWVLPYIDVLKIGSGDFNCLPIIQEVLSYEKEIILSTGLCFKNEVDQVYSWIKSRVSSEFLREKVTLMQCTSMYPIPANEVNLSVVDSYRASYDCKVGYSDHTLGNEALQLAIAMQVDSIEYHYTLNKADSSFRDNLVSLERDDVEYLNLYWAKVSQLRGYNEKRPTKSELDSNHVYSFRRGCYAKRDLYSGEIISSNDVLFRRPFVKNSLSPTTFVSENSEYKVKTKIKKGDIILINNE
jgi:N,N'-diacetyllegionaminate synthase